MLSTDRSILRFQAHQSMSRDIPESECVSPTFRNSIQTEMILSHLKVGLHFLVYHRLVDISNIHMRTHTLVNNQCPLLMGDSWLATQNNVLAPCCQSALSPNASRWSMATSSLTSCKSSHPQKCKEKNKCYFDDSSDDNWQGLKRFLGSA